MLRTLVIITGLALAACSVGEVQGAGDDDTPDANNNDPNAMSFNQMVKPLAQRCQNGGCHKTGGTQPSPNFDSFTTLQAKYKVKPGMNNILVNHVTAGGLHQSSTPADAGVWWSATEQTTVAGWIDSLP